MKVLSVIVILAVFSPATLMAQKLNQRLPHLQSSWIGNSFSGGLKWVQHTADEMMVSPDGTINTWTNYEEANRNFGVYKGYQRDDGTWYGDVIGNKFVDFNGGAVKIGSTEWSIDGYVDFSGYDNGRTQRTGTIVKRKNSSIQIAGLQKATSLGVDYKHHYLMITDDGPQKHVVLFYDTLGNYVKQMGIPGGIWPSSVGGDASQDGVIDSDLKFYYMTGCGADSTGNIYVGMSEIYAQAGFWIRCFDPSGSTLLWELHSNYFTDFSDMDRTKDGNEVYSTFRKYVMDLTKPPGEQYTLAGFTFNPYKFPADQRMNTSSRAPQVRYINGTKFLFYTGQNTHGFWVFKFDPQNFGETAIPTGIFLETGDTQNSISIDQNGNFWGASAGDIRVKKAMGIDVNGNPQYADTKSYPMPPEFSKIEHCYYVGGADDEMLVGGFEPGETDALGYSEVGKQLARYKNWTTSPTLVWINKAIPFSHHDALPVASRVVNKSVFEAGDYIFIDYVIHDTNDYDVDAPGVIDVFSKATGEFAGEIFAGPEINWQSSWHDIQISFNVMQRSNGEYFLLSEDNWKSKNIIYRWCPSGNCERFEYPTVSVATSDRYAVESNGHPAEFTFTRTLAGGPLTLKYTYKGTAGANDFSTPLTGSVSFADGQDTVKLKLMPVNDGLPEGDEQFILSLQQDTSYWINSNSEVASVYVFDTPKPTVKLFASVPSIREDGTTSSVVMIKRDIADTDLRVSLAVSGTASRLDYNETAIARHVVIPAGQFTYTAATLTAAEDLIAEGDEDIGIRVLDSVNYIITDSSFVSVIIKDDDTSTDPAGVISCYPFTEKITIDGILDEPQWKFVTEISKDNDGANNNQAFFAVGWDTLYYYLAVKVYDDVLRKNNANPWENDGAEIYIDGNHNGGALEPATDDQYIMNYGDAVLWDATKKTNGVKYKSLVMPGNTGYTIEMAIPWYLFVKTLSPDLVVGFDISIDDNDDTKRYNTIVWNGDGNDYSSTSKYGEIVLKNTAGWKLGKTRNPSDTTGVTKPPVVTGLHEEGNAGASVYPNPFHHGELTIELTGAGAAPRALQFYDLRGQSVYSAIALPGEPVRVARNVFPDRGVYFVRITSSEGVAVRKIIVL